VTGVQTCALPISTEVPFSSATRNPNVANRGPAYGIPSVGVDGNDVLAVHAAAREAVARARAGGGPTLLECRTYRTRSHAEGMRDVGYRTRDEVEEWKARDPLQRLKEHALAAGLAAAGDFETIEAEVQAVVEEAAEFAKNSPWPDPATATRYIYSEARHA
jgi:2-oxoisovalerate dehydrogenase E1 component